MGEEIETILLQFNASGLPKLDLVKNILNVEKKLSPQYPNLLTDERT